tara:strand:+ start:24 stop:332 length:309 start_codon:yes stop_codon:yes gene_type:complete
MIEKEEKFLLFKSKKIKDHLILYIDADLRNLDGTWCFFCSRKLKKNNKKMQDWYAVNSNAEFEQFKKIALEEFDFKFGPEEAIPRFFYCCNDCKNITKELLQ